MQSNIEEQLKQSAAFNQWKQFGIGSYHGIAVPLFSLHTHASCGLGEFLDLLPLIRWMKRVGMDVLQLLPLNDTHSNPSPYSICSSLALNPIHISLHPLCTALPEIKPLCIKLQQYCSRVDIPYGDIIPQREKILQFYFDHAYEKEKNSPEWIAFSSQPWLSDYACYKVLKERFKNQSWQQWPFHYQHLNDEIQRECWQEKKEQMQFYQFVQFLAHRQLSSVKQYAEQQGVRLLGDLPIFINRDSCDVWACRDCFRLDHSVGAPPDMYNPHGQDWGFPAYNWETIKEDNYSWWKRRLQSAEQFYHSFRIDHAVGFFRAWITEKGAKKGHFIPNTSEKWLAQGKEILEMMLSSTSMLPIAEDLGVVPPEVRTTLKQLGICGMKVMRWERDWEGNRDFIPIEQYELQNLTTLSTHDSQLLQEWWESCTEESQWFCKNKQWTFSQSLTEEKRFALLLESHCAPTLFSINLLPEYLALFADLVWPDPKYHRINIPGTLSSSNWGYRLRPSIDDFSSHEAFCDSVTKIIKKSSQEPMP